MSTRAIIAMPVAAGPLPRADAPRGFWARLLGLGPVPELRGVYHHNGGRPDELGALLWQLVTVRYAGDVRRCWRELITGNPAGWSSLHALGDDAAARAWDGRRKRTAEAAFAAPDLEPDLPVTYQGDPKRDLGFRTPPITQASDKMGAEYVYVVCPDELVIFTVRDDGRGVAEGARVGWAAPPDWDAVSEQIERAR